MNLIGLITFPMFDTKNDWYAFVFIVDEFEGELIDSPEGDLEWIDDKKLPELNLWEGDRVFLPWTFEDRFFSAKFVYENGEYKEYSVEFY
jgi:8-oxo-dGTP diphosphatase